MKKEHEEEWSLNMEEGEKEVNQQLMESYNMGTIDVEQKKPSEEKPKNERF